MVSPQPLREGAGFTTSRKSFIDSLKRERSGRHRLSLPRVRQEKTFTSKWFEVWGVFLYELNTHNVVTTMHEFVPIMRGWLLGLSGLRFVVDRVWGARDWLAPTPMILGCLCFFFARVCGRWWITPHQIAFVMPV